MSPFPAVVWAGPGHPRGNCHAFVIGLVQETAFSGTKGRVAAASAVFGACRWFCLWAIGKACAKPPALPLPPTQTVIRF